MAYKLGYKKVFRFRQKQHMELHLQKSNRRYSKWWYWLLQDCETQIV